MKHALVLRLGRVPYGLALQLQRRLHGLRRMGQVPNTILSLEHEPVVTLGRDGSPQDLLLPEGELQKKGVEVFFVERGGAATYHGPGQLVLYPVLHLRELGLSLRKYVWGLEEVMIQSAKAFGVELLRRPGHPGAWHRRGKVGFLGVYVRGWVTMHGLALNVDLNPNGFRWIVPCGMPKAPVASLRDVLGYAPPLAHVEETALSAFSRVFEVELVELSRTEAFAWLSRNGLR